MADSWDIGVGEHLSRDERRSRFGGAPYGGIQPSRSTPNVFVYSDPSRGEEYGYNFDGWSEDGSVFLYTGEGQVGDQEMKAVNRAILEHVDRGRALRVFVADGTVPGRSAKLHRYIGEFRVDPEFPWFPDEAPDINGETRSVIVFRLRPVDATATITPGETSETGDAPATPQCAEVPPEAYDAQTFDRKGSEPTTAERTESALVKRYETFLEGLGHKPGRYKLRAPGVASPMFTDTVDHTTNELTEAKGTTARSRVREAVGQLLDYRRLTTPTPANLAVLLPADVSADVRDFIHHAGMDVIYETSPGDFDRHKRP